MVFQPHSDYGESSRHNSQRSISCWKQPVDIRMQLWAVLGRNRDRAVPMPYDCSVCAIYHPPLVWPLWPKWEIRVRPRYPPRLQTTLLHSRLLVPVRPHRINTTIGLGRGCARIAQNSTLQLVRRNQSLDTNSSDPALLHLLPSLHGFNMCHDRHWPLLLLANARGTWLELCRLLQTVGGFRIIILILIWVKPATKPTRSHGQEKIKFTSEEGGRERVHIWDH